MLTESDIALLKGKEFAIIGTNSQEKGPQLTPVWIDTDGTNAIFNTSKGRVKHRNILADPNITICIVDSANPYHWISISGVAEMTEEGADAHIDFLAKKYLDQESYPYRAPGEVRVIVKVRPTSRASS